MPSRFFISRCPRPSARLLAIGILLLLPVGGAKAEGTREVFRWELDQKSDTPAGVTIADINRDGLPDIVIGHHFKSPWKNPAPVRLYLNRSVTDGVPKFEDITEAAGLKPLEIAPLNAPGRCSTKFCEKGRSCTWRVRGTK